MPLECGSPIGALAPCLVLHELQLRQVQKHTSCLQNVACPSAHWPMLVLQQPQLRRVHARTTRELKLDPERPEYHRVTLSFRK